MPKKKNTTLRILVPLIGFLVIIGVGIAVSGGLPSRGQTTPASPDSQAATANDPAGSSPDALQSTTADPAETLGDQSPQAQPEALIASESTTDQPQADLPQVNLEDLKARIDPNAQSTFGLLGSNDTLSDYEFQIQFTPFGSGIQSLQLTHEFNTVEHKQHYELQSAMRGNASVSVSPRELEAAFDRIRELGQIDTADPLRAEAYSAAAAALTTITLGAWTNSASDLPSVTSPEAADLLISRIDTWLVSEIIPFALLAVEIDGHYIDLSNYDAQTMSWDTPRGVWVQQSPGVFTATIENSNGDPVVSIRRVFEIAPESHEISLRQSVQNLTGSEMAVRLIQTGPIDPPKSKSTYGGDKRRVRFGYLLDPEAQAGDPTVLADNQLRHHHEYLGKKKLRSPTSPTKTYAARDQVWPSTKALKKDWRLVWAGLTDRYFAITVHPIIASDDQIHPDQKLMSQITSIDRLVLNSAASNVQNATVVLDLKAPAVQLAAGRTLQSNFGIYAGPLSKPVVQAETGAKVLGLDKVIVYNFGSCTSACTFGWLTHLLLEVLRFNRMITFDWAIAIILLVIMVRTVLHPITRWSQIKMQRFGVQMQSMGPKQQKLKEKYKDDPRKLQQETAKLWKEEGISPTGFLGCLPMFLQSPVWIALYATLFFAVELRHEPAFYGFFQTISSGNWAFLADLSAPDAALPLGPLSFKPPIIGNFTGVIDTINILPLLMGFVFYAHQKYLTPPTSATLTPEQKSQQKMIKMMSVIMFPLIMYPAPSGLAIYFVTNSTIAIFENRHIRAHMKKHGMLDPEKIKASKANKKPGFMARLQKIAEAQQQAKAQAENQGKGYGTGKNRGMKASKPVKKTINRQYKKKN